MMDNLRASVWRHLRRLVFLSCMFIIQHIFRVDAKQNLAKPSPGIGGRLVGLLFAWFNEDAIDQALAEVQMDGNSMYLEVGFGPGTGIKRACKRGVKKAYGLDVSEAMLQEASRLNAVSIRENQAKLALYNVDDGFPHELIPHPVDIIFSSHCIYFWKRPLFVLEEFVQNLNPGGTLITVVSFWLPGEEEQQKKKKSDDGKEDPFLNRFNGKKIAELYKGLGLVNIHSMIVGTDRVAVYGHKKTVK